MILFTGEGPRTRKLLKHCLVCGKKKHLVYYGTLNSYILQICNKCLDVNCVVSELGGSK